MNNPKVLAFDVFGTIVDWYGSIYKEVAETFYGEIDADKFALAWRAGYAPAMQRVMSGELEWTLIDDLHRMILDELLSRFQIDSLTEEQIYHLNKVWHRLEPWPDSVEGLTRLKSNFLICTLSNGNIALLTNMAKHGKLPWDCILSAEFFRKYKPDPSTYLGVANTFRVNPGEVMLVASHHNDLSAARQCGLKTAFIERPMEFGPIQGNDTSPRIGNDLHCLDILDLAKQLDC
ncbi:MAG: haloacid dehalogenase type II [Gammaproteobacteria bacterium]|nr:haloacid dehalogenase type II [Gammaproteobacteria bacterium]MCY4220018.1 haloacid dehalogenase type II [Gammaproteobacteria bacterium]